MNRIAAALALGLSALTAGCATTPTGPAPDAAAIEQREAVTILISIDGFHPDYLDRGITPTLSELAASGASGAMRPSFPTKTFPNHWTLVTGLVPDKHGITANRMEDRDRPDEVFTMSNVDPYWWGEAKPIWVEAEEQGVRTASMFWPGSAVPWGGTAVRFGPVPDGTLPSDWQAFSMQVSNVQRVNSVLDWLRRPADIRPKFVTLYFDTVDTAGHDDGPVGEEIDAAIAAVDRDIANLRAGLRALGQPANLVIVSDHGMAPTSSERVIALDEILDEQWYRLVESGAYATFEPSEGHEDALADVLGGEHANMECWPKGDMPARFQYGTHPRIPAWFCLPDTGWTIVRTRSSAVWSGGNHGYDPAAQEMTSLFIASGPAFRQAVTVSEFQNTRIAPLLRGLLGLRSAQAKDALGPLEAALAPLM